MSQSHPDDHSLTHARGRGIVGVIGVALHLPGFGHGHDHGVTSLAADRACWASRWQSVDCTC